MNTGVVVTYFGRQVPYLRGSRVAALPLCDIILFCKGAAVSTVRKENSASKVQGKCK